MIFPPEILQDSGKNSQISSDFQEEHQNNKQNCYIKKDLHALFILKYLISQYLSSSITITKKKILKTVNSIISLVNELPCFTKLTYVYTNEACSVACPNFLLDELQYSVFHQKEKWKKYILYTTHKCWPSHESSDCKHPSPTANFNNHLLKSSQNMMKVQ